jgi:hypothetical protein
MDIIALLKVERDKAARQNGLNAALAAFVGTYKTAASRPRRKMSAAARARISAAQKARWAKAKGQKVIPITSRQAPHLTSRSSADQGGEQGEMGEVEERQKATLGFSSLKALCLKVPVPVCSPASLTIW